MKENLISIIVPVYNAAPFLYRMLDSICCQTYKQWELILLDDASTDNSLEILQQWKQTWERKIDNEIILISHTKNQGPAATRNEGIRLAKGRYLAYLDADDYWEKEKLEKQWKFMKKTGCIFSFTGYEFANKNGMKTGKVVYAPEKLTYQDALKNTIISTITVMFDRGQISESLLLMPEDSKREDTATWWNILREGYVAYGIKEPLSVYCRHRGSHSANKLKAVYGTWQLYRKQERLSLFDTLRYMSGYLHSAISRRL